MSKALIVGGDQIDGIKQVLAGHGIAGITHWSGRKVGDSNKVIPHDVKLIVLITDWISHSFTRKIKLNAAKRGVRIVYTPNGSATLRTRLDRLSQNGSVESDCSQRNELNMSSVFRQFSGWINTFATKAMT